MTFSNPLELIKAQAAINDSLRSVIERQDGIIESQQEEIWKLRQVLFKAQFPEVWRAIREDPESLLNEYITLE